MLVAFATGRKESVGGKSGFTPVEMLLVVAIIGFLAAILLLSVGSYSLMPSKNGQKPALCS